MPPLQDFLKPRRYFVYTILSEHFTSGVFDILCISSGHLSFTSILPVKELYLLPFLVLYSFLYLAGNTSFSYSIACAERSRPSQGKYPLFWPTLRATYSILGKSRIKGPILSTLGRDPGKRGGSAPDGLENQDIRKSSRRWQIASKKAPH